MKGTSEARARVALKAAGLWVYKPPDDARNWKPCDFFTWQLADDPAGDCVGLSLSRWIEVKQVPVSALSLSALHVRSSQRAGVTTASLLKIPYWLLIYWQHPKIPAKSRWTCLEMTQFAGIYQTRPYHGTQWDGMGSVNECVAEMIA